jgi:hypothetical protein
VISLGTATTITSGGNRNPANADFGGSQERGRFDSFTGQACLDLANDQRNRARGRLRRRVRPAPLRTFTSAEVRTWWVNGGCVLAGPPPDTPDDRPDIDVDLAAVTPLITGLGLPFVTVDLALRDDGQWRVVELGDGQVSDQPTTIEPATFMAALLPGLQVTGASTCGQG